MPSSNSSNLLHILARARSGALDLAWRLFVEGGFDALVDDEAALSVKGRLLKGQAARTRGEARQRLLLDSADAYARSAALGGGSYPLINAATLSLLAGDGERAGDLARQVLGHLESHPDEPETPYYLAATQAEALLLLGRTEDARRAFADAVALAPRAWEDHASTLRQFALILATTGKDATWLQGFQPPRSLHFGGHMSFRAAGREDSLMSRIASVLESEHIGFGYGALAAGADILVAEALLERGAELHLVLPGGADAFAEQSVDPFGSAWRRRFDAALSRAETIRTVAPAGARPGSETIALADEVAMGTAIENACRLDSAAVQLLILAEATADTSAGARALWNSGDAARQQHILIAPREESAVQSEAAHGEPALAAIATLVIGGLDSAPEASTRATNLAAVEAIFDAGPTAAVPPAFLGDVVVAGYSDPVVAARIASALARAVSPTLSIGSDYGMSQLVVDPFCGWARVTGRPLLIARAAAASAWPGTTCVSQDFAAALQVSASDRFRCEIIGELVDPECAEPIAIYSLVEKLQDHFLEAP